MKNTIRLFFILLCSYSFAQAPQAFNYQAQSRDNSGNPLSNKSIAIKISILNGSATGSIDYTETHNVSTDENGIFSFSVGTGAVVSGTFTTIDWSGGQKYLKVELDQDGGSNFINMGTTQLLSVPFALQAENVTNDKYIDDDADTTNELQTISISNDSITLSDGGFIILPPLPNDNDRDSTNELQGLSSVLTQGNDAGVTKITNLLNPTDAQDAATKAYIDSLMIQIGRADKLLSAGYTIQQLLNGGQTVSDLLTAGVNETDLLAAGVSVADISAARISASYPFNGNANDDSGKGNNGIVFEAALTTDQFGNANSAYIFDGVDDHIKVPNNSGLNFGVDDFTVSLWFKTTATTTTGTGRDDLIAKGQPSVSGYALSLKDNKIRFSLGNFGGLNSSSALNDGQWHHVVGVRGSGSIELYIDGLLDVSSANNESLNTSNDLLIGKHGVKNESYYDGILDDIIIYNVALDQTEILNLFSGG